MDASLPLLVCIHSVGINVAAAILCNYFMINKKVKLFILFILR